MVDTNGLVLSVFVSAADMDERDGAKSLLNQVAGRFPRLSKIWADNGYSGPFVDWVKEQLGLDVEIIKRTDNLKGFKIVPRRWVVERTFGWFGRFKRLAKDYELLPEHSESMIYLAMMRLMLRRLVNQPFF
jgi:putative transposase